MECLPPLWDLPVSVASAVFSFHDIFLLDPILHSPWVCFPSLQLLLFATYQEDEFHCCSGLLLIHFFLFICMSLLVFPSICRVLHYPPRPVWSPSSYTSSTPISKRSVQFVSYSSLVEGSLHGSPCPAVLFVLVLRIPFPPVRFPPFTLIKPSL